MLIGRYLLLNLLISVVIDTFADGEGFHIAKPVPPSVEDDLPPLQDESNRPTRSGTSRCSG